MFYPDDVSIGHNNLLHFADKVMHKEPTLFYLNAAKDYFLTPTIESNPLIYAHYEKNHQFQDESLFKKYNLDYNLKLILPGRINGEYHKTIPHFHIEDDLTGETYPEIHEVLEGEGIVLLQKNKQNHNASKVIAVPFVKGDHIYIKNGFGHTTINTGDDPVLIASLIERNSQRGFTPLAEKKGNLYYLLEKDGASHYVLNELYDESVGLEILSSPTLNNPVAFAGGLYESFVNDPEHFSVLRK